MRTFEELNDAVRIATGINDASSLMQCADELDALGTSEAVTEAHFARGVGFFYRGNYPSALEQYQRALTMYEELGNRKGMAVVTGNIGSVHRRTGNSAAALENYHRALAMHEELGNSSYVAIITSNIGNVHNSTGNYPAALEHYHRAMALHEGSGNSNELARVTNGIGIVHMSTGNYPAALEHYHRALSLFEELGNRSGVASVTGNIGIVHYNTGNYPVALEHFQHSLAMHEERGERSGVAYNTGNIGNAYDSIGNYTAALEYFRRALVLHEELGESSAAALVTSNILSTMLRAGTHAEAETLLQTMDAWKIDNPVVVVQREQHRASLQEHHGALDDAKATLRAALQIAHAHSLAPQQATLQRSLRDLALKQNDLAAYVEHNNEFTRITEEINGKEATLKMAMQEKQREIDAREREVQKHMAVLHSTLPKHVAERVARGEVVNDHFDNASVIFLDIVGFTELSSSMSSQEVITLLDTIFSQCDAICEQHNVTKIKTIGDSYMCVSFESVVNAALAAVNMSRISHSVSHEVSHSVSHEVSHSVSHAVLFRIGIHCGPVTAGVIGTQRMQYDVWGDTVNVASRMESTGEAGRVHVSEAFALNLKSNQESRVKYPISESNEVPLVTRHSSLVSSSESLVTIERGWFDIKGKGPMNTYWLERIP